MQNIELNTIYNEDCLETMKRMEGAIIDLTITSPPYNFDLGSGLGNKYSGQKDRMNMNDYFEWSCVVIDELLRVSKLVCYNIQFLSGNKEALMRIMGKYYKEIREILIYDKKNAEPAMNIGVLNSEFEFILIMDKQGGGRKIDQANFERGTASNMLRIGKHSGNFEGHNAAFPEQLPDRLINYFSKENDIIFDPFIGTGTTAISAIKYKRQFMGSEINEDFFNLAKKRITNKQKQSTIF